MKTKKLFKKLVLNKETISTLDSTKMAMPKGGVIETAGDVCSNACASWDDLAFCNSWYPHKCLTFLC